MADTFAVVGQLDTGALIDSITIGHQWKSHATIKYSTSYQDAVGYKFGIPKITKSISTAFDDYERLIDLKFEFIGSFSDPHSAYLAGSDINIALDGYKLFKWPKSNSLGAGLPPDPEFSREYLRDEIFYEGSEGDIFINPESDAATYAYNPGDEGYFLLLHEIGHALGLKHPHDDGGVSRPTFNSSGLASLDSDWLTVMSYRDNYRTITSAFDPASPMILDIIALQYLYGPNNQNNSGDDQFRLAIGKGQYNSIFDPSGTDTLDLSDSESGVFVDLPKYRFSEHQEFLAGIVSPIDQEKYITTKTSPQSLTWIIGHFEKIIGSDYSDRIFGSNIDEVIESGSGSDTIYAGKGADLIDGGEGTDWVYFNSSIEECLIAFEGQFCYITGPEDEAKKLTNIEVFVFGYANQKTILTLRELGDCISDFAGQRQSAELRILQRGEVLKLSRPSDIFGTGGPEDLTIEDVDGLFILDPSFNRGDDILRLAGSVSDWLIRKDSSGAFLSDGDTFVDIPVGREGITIFWGDESRKVLLDTASGQVRLGEQNVSENYSFVMASADVNASDHENNVGNSSLMLTSAFASHARSVGLELENNSASGLAMNLPSRIDQMSLFEQNFSATVREELIKGDGYDGLLIEGTYGFDGALRVDFLTNSYCQNVINAIGLTICY